MLSEQQGLLLRALQPLEEGEGKEKVSHQAGDHWLIRGPLEYVPPAKVEVVEERQAIPLDENEGIYVQDVIIAALCKLETQESGDVIQSSKA